MRVLVCWLVLGAVEAAAQSRGAMAREMLAAHNAVRARVGLAQLVWSAALARTAQEWAERLVARREFGHRPGTPLGENLFSITGGAATPGMVAGEWAAEAKDYDWGRNRCRGVCGHYTQMVWRETERVGCGVARGRGREVWVCNYDPAGNWDGRRPY
jgi:pathogenesis-related protein 1